MPEPRTSNGFIGIIVAVACVIELAVMGRAVTPLVIGLMLSYLLWISQADWRPTRDMMLTYLTAVFVQCLHLIEEYSTGFYRVFPPILGGQPWSPARFLAFNLTWLAVFVVAGIRMRTSRRPAFLVAVFLGLGGGIANGLGHLALAAQRGGYFPGTYTSVLALFTGAHCSESCCGRSRSSGSLGRAMPEASRDGLRSRDGVAGSRAARGCAHDPRWPLGDAPPG